MNPCCVYDFTLNRKIATVTELQKKLNQIAKKWTFQVEEGKDGYEHYQGRISLKMKKRIGDAIKIFGIKEAHLSITSNENKKNDFYACKEESRIDGPYKDTDYVEVYIPRQIREIKKLYPWQEKVIEISKVWNKRHINVIIDKTGNIGKSILCQYMSVHRIGRKIPYCNNYKDLMRMVCDIPTSSTYLIDLPRAIDKDKVGGMYSAIEEIKGGYAWDDRYKFKEKHFDCPNIWVFTNSIPNRGLLSNDRWLIWTIQNKELISSEIGL